MFKTAWMLAFRHDRFMGLFGQPASLVLRKCMDREYVRGPLTLAQRNASPPERVNQHSRSSVDRKHMANGTA